MLRAVNPEYHKLEKQAKRAARGRRFMTPSASSMCSARSRTLGLAQIWMVGLVWFQSLDWVEMKQLRVVAVHIQIETLALQIVATPLIHFVT